MKKKFITVFGSYRAGEDDAEYKAAYELGYKIAQKGFILKNGGGSGIMEASRLGVEKGGGKVIGVVLSALKNERAGNTCEDIIECRDIYQRLKVLIEGSEAFIIFGGGTGTLAELALVLDLKNKGLISIGVPIICYGSFWEGVVDILKDEPSYSGTKYTDLIKFSQSVDEILSLIERK
jgi:uncharacterized protein (TIGR00730 family)